MRNKDRNENVKRLVVCCCCCRRCCCRCCCRCQCRRRCCAIVRSMKNIVWLSLLKKTVEKLHFSSITFCRFKLPIRVEFEEETFNGYLLYAKFETIRFFWVWKIVWNERKLTKNRPGSKKIPWTFVTLKAR